uniref:Reverse transcriptase domain-containing protein n=1 Tax=Lactuca sativa TaxID=4236 RepID=A0A9R1WGG6_LACSA|nr:hypothetical protein LSAT_V11C200085810 [Lactuca sativa]
MSYYHSSVLHTDDALFVGEWSKSNLKNLARILRCFHAASELKVSFHKSRVFRIDASVNETLNRANILGCEAGSFPFKYLGVQVVANMKLIKTRNQLSKNFLRNYPLGSLKHCHSVVE